MHRLNNFQPRVKKRSKSITNSPQHWAGCIMEDVCMKFHKPMYAGCSWKGAKFITNIAQASVKSRSRLETVNGSGQCALWQMCV